VKTTLRVQEVQDFLDKLDQAKTWLEEYKDYNIYGAVAYLREESGSATYAEKKKLFVIRATGKSATIINEEHFVPRVF
jgi:hypothetical protein